MIGNLQSALATYEAAPSSTAAAQGVLTAAQDLTASLNAGATAVSQVQEQADQDMANSVSTINNLLGQFEQANNTVVAGLASGADVSQAEDTRDSILTQLSQQIGISTTTNSNGSMSIYTESGVTLFQDVPQTVSFTPTTTYVAGTLGNAVTVDGIPITGSSAPMAIESGALAGYAELRDTIAPQYQAQLDQIAGGLISAFAETDQSAIPTLPALPGLFTASGLTSVPSDTTVYGPRRRDRGQSQCRPERRRRHQPVARRRHIGPRQSRLHVQYDRVGELHRANSADGQRADHLPAVRRAARVSANPTASRATQANR